jgi:hypothetical protein
MAIQTKLSLFIGADVTVRVDVKQSDEVTAQTMTGWALSFVLRRANDDGLVVNKSTGTGITIGNGSGTDDRASVALLRADTSAWPAGDNYAWALWRTDSGSDLPLAYGSAVLVKAVAQV